MFLVGLQNIESTQIKHKDIHTYIDWKSACERLSEKEIHVHRNVFVSKTSKIACIEIIFNLMVYEMDLPERAIGEL